MIMQKELTYMTECLRRARNIIACSSFHSLDPFSAAGRCISILPASSCTLVQNVVAEYLMLISCSDLLASFGPSACLQGCTVAETTSFGNLEINHPENRRDLRRE